MQEEPKKRYRVRLGETLPTHPELEPGEIIELTDAEAEPYAHILEEVPPAELPAPF